MGLAGIKVVKGEQSKKKINKRKEKMKNHQRDVGMSSIFIRRLNETTGSM